MQNLWYIWGNQPFDLAEKAKALVRELVGANPAQGGYFAFDLGEVMADASGQLLFELRQAAESLNIFTPEVLIQLSGLEKLKKPTAADALKRELGSINLIKSTLENEEAWLDQDSLTNRVESHHHLTGLQMVEEVLPLGQNRYYLALHPAWQGRRIWRQKGKDFIGLSTEELLQERCKAKLVFTAPEEAPASGGGRVEVVSQWMEELLQDPPPGVKLILLAELRKLNELPSNIVKLLEQKGKEIKGLVAYDDFRPANWVVERARALQLQLPPRVAGLLIDWVGADLGLLAMELEKLSLVWAGRGALQEEDVLRLASPSSRFSVFLAVEQLCTKDLWQGIKNLEQILNEKRMEPAALFALLTSQFRKFLKVHWLLAGGLNPKELANQLKLHPWLAEKVTKQAMQFDLPELERILLHLAEQDLRIKQGPKDALAILENFAFLLHRGGFRSSGLRKPVA